MKLCIGVRIVCASAHRATETRNDEPVLGGSPTGGVSFSCGQRKSGSTARTMNMSSDVSGTKAYNRESSS